MDVNKYMLYGHVHKTNEYNVLQEYIQTEYHFLYGVVCMCVVNIVMCVLKNRKIRIE